MTIERQTRQENKQEDDLASSIQYSERKLGETETSYYLPSRENGVNDMYLHLGFNAPASRITRERVLLVWTILRLRHPLLASRVEMNGYKDIRFIYRHPICVEDAIKCAGEALSFCSQSKDDLINNYLNGPRTLSNDRLSHLIISCQSNTVENEQFDPNIERQYEFFLCAMHFIGDGMALHTFSNHFFGILGSPLSLEGLRTVLNENFAQLYGKQKLQSVLPEALESRLPALPDNKFFQATAEIDFQLSKRKLIGGHTFPRKKGQPRHTIVPTVPFDTLRTKAILQNCKNHGVSISTAFFAVCNFAWAKTQHESHSLPIMMYSALNLRPYLLPMEGLKDSYWFTCIGYFNVVLPAFIPRSGDAQAIFWHRARSAKKQSTEVMKHPLLIPRAHQMARERGRNARMWAKEDDDRASGVFFPPSKPLPSPSEPLVPASKSPSMALIGLSLLGNLDGIYKHDKFPDIKLHTLTTGSRQRPGGMLMFVYTFAGKLWVSLGYDENGLEKEMVGKFWDNVLAIADEYL